MKGTMNIFLQKWSIRFFIAFMAFSIGMQAGAPKKSQIKRPQVNTKKQSQAKPAQTTQVAAQQKTGNLAAARGTERQLQAARGSQERIRTRAAGRVALQKEIAKQEERDSIDARPLNEVAASTTPTRFVQTEAHLQLPYVRELIAKNYKVEPYLDTISTVIANEARYKDTHYAFYNTTSNMWRLAQDLYTRLFVRFNPEKKLAGFKFLRFDDESVNASAQGFLVNELREKGLVDDNSATAAVLLSVNLALFGNVGFAGECSWQYFVSPAGHRAPYRETYEKMMNKFGLTDKYIDQLMALVDIYDTKEDTIVQVLVPKNKIDEIGYLAWVKGIPAHQGTIDSILRSSKSKSFEKVKPTMEKLTAQFAAQKESNPLYKDMMEGIQSGDFGLDAFLKVLCNKPWELKEANDYTARLLFTPDVLLNPDSGVKFYRFSTASKSKLKEYNTKLNAIIDKLVAEKDAQDDAEAAAAA